MSGRFEATATEGQRSTGVSFMFI